MSTFIEARVIQKVDTEANWLSNPLKLYQGEIAFVSDKYNFKLNNTDIPKTFAELDYYAPDVKQIDDIVDVITGSGSLTLYIESSKGDLLDLDDLNTTLTPYVDRYFNDATDKVTSWKWYRESGITQEDKDADDIWAIDKNHRILNLTAEDFTHNILEHGVTFICEARIEKRILKARVKI